MKKNCLIAILMFFCFIQMCYSQAPIWQWANGATGTSTVSAVATDANSNVYVTGTFIGSLVFGSDTITDTLAAYQDVFIAKYNAEGNILWVKNASGYADIFGVSTDLYDNVFIVGDFYNATIAFDTNVLTDPSPGAQVSNIYLVKYDSSGNVTWAKNLGGINNDQAAGLSTDATGNVYITGTFSSDSLRLGNITVQHIGYTDGFVSKINASGDPVWIRTVGSPGLDGNSAICTDATDNVYVTGYFQSNELYVGGTANTITSPYSNNIFINKYDSSGNIQWTRYAGGNNNTTGTYGTTGIASDGAGNVYVCGYFEDSIFLGMDTLEYYGSFTAKYNAVGAIQWAKGSATELNGIAADVNGNSYVTGYFYTDTLFWGNSAIANNIYNQTTFASKYDTYGNPEWGIAPMTQNINAGAGISYNNGNIYIVGNFQSAAIIFGDDTLPSSDNFFLAKCDTTIANGIRSLSNEPIRITAYPNPSTGNVYFIGAGNGNVLEVYDLLGKPVYNLVFDKDNSGIDLRTQPQGMYTYQINDRNGSTIGEGKIIVQLY